MTRSLRWVIPIVLLTIGLTLGYLLWTKRRKNAAVESVVSETISALDVGIGDQATDIRIALVGIHPDPTYDASEAIQIIQDNTNVWYTWTDYMGPILEAISGKTRQEIKSIDQAMEYATGSDLHDYLTYSLSKADYKSVFLKIKSTPK